MPGDAKASRRGSRGLWPGVWLAVLCSGGLRASDEPSSSALRAQDQDVVLSARRVLPWDGPDGRWVWLAGDVVLSQNGQSLRANEAVARIRELTNAGSAKSRRVDIYAEWTTKTAPGKTSPASRRLVLQTAGDVRLEPREAGGLLKPSGSPWQLAIVRRSGLLDQNRAATATRTAARPAPLDPEVVAASQQAARSPKRDPAVDPALAPAPAAAAADPAVQRARAQVPDDPRPSVDLPPIEGAPEVQVPNLDEQPRGRPAPTPTPGPEGITVPALPETPPDEKPKGPPPSIVPIIAGSQRITTINPRTGRPISIRELPTTSDGVRTFIIRGGINMLTRTEKSGVIDIEADEAVVWRGPGREKGAPVVGPNGELWVDDASQPMEIYLEGNVVLRQDENKFAGKGDQKTIRAPRLYYDFLTDRCLAPDADMDLFAPGFLLPINVKSPRIEQFRAPIPLPNGSYALAEHAEIRANNAVMTGSRFPIPGYRFTMQSIDLTQYNRPLTDPNTGKEVSAAAKGKPKTAEEEETVWHFDARQNIYFMGPIPAFYWPHIVGDIDDLEPPLRQIFFVTNNYFGQQLRTDWNGFRFLGQKKPKWIDQWNIDVDYLSARTKNFPALGSEMGWFGNDLWRDLTDPYHKGPPQENYTQNYFGYFDVYGLQDLGTDVLGSGPAIVTNGPPGAGKAGFQRFADPQFQTMRGRLTFRHNQRFLPEDEDHQFEELRAQLEVGYASDRNFIEEYYKMLFDTGIDQETMAYGIYQKNSQAMELWSSAVLQNWYTDTQWLPRADYYRLGDSLLDNRFLYYQHSGIDYATVHTDIMVNNPNLFAFLPYDPISNTTGIWSSGRAYTSHEIDMPLNFGNVFRLVPYAQGQLVGWSNQLGGGPLGHQSTGAMGRAWGAAGARAEFTAWKKYGKVESEIMNVHGLNNKISLFLDARAAYSNVNLNSIGIQDTLDANTYEYVRRYFALTSFAGGLLPTPYDPRHLLLRQTLSPITATTDLQASIQTVQLGIHQRLQTKRGPYGKRRIVDYMTLDATTTYFPDSQRDNFGVPWGQAMYNWQWFLGDRTSIISTGWFDFFKLVGSQPLSNNLVQGYNPNGLNIITTGVSISRPPRTNYYVGYSIIDTGPIKTSALNASIAYWLSPKWYGTYSTSYDFGDAILLASMFSFTRIGADYLTSFGLAVDPQRGSFNFSVQLTPRLSTGTRLGSGMSQFDTRYAPTQ